MNKYKVGISRNFYYEFEVIAINKEEAEDKANENFDMLTLYGSELYDDFNGKVELIEENVKADDDDE